MADNDNKKYTKECSICHEQFMTNNKRQTQCDKEHHDKCILCGKDFIKTRPNQQTCHMPHEMICPICGDEFFVKHVVKDKKYYGCGKATCRQEITKRTNLEKYGVDNPAKVKEFQEKAKKTNLERYGVEYTGQSETIKEKKNKTLMDKYGTLVPMRHVPKIMAKREKTLKEKYGSTNIMDSVEVRNKIKETTRKHYGVDYSTQSKQVQDKMRQSIKAKYGVDNPMHSDKIKEKLKQTNLKKYGVDNPMKHEKIKEKVRKTTNSRYGVDNVDYVNFAHLEDYLNLKEFIKDNNKTLSELATYFNMSRQRLRENIRQQGLQDYIPDFYVSSIKENDLESLIKTLDVNYVRNDRTTIYPKELDFYFPNNKLAVEISPSSTHNSLKGMLDSEPKDKDYHKNKFLACDRQGIELITIFDWMPWDNVVELITTKLQNTNNRIPARKTKYTEYTKITPELFNMLNDWHTLGLPTNFKRDNVVSALVYDDDIVGLALWTDTKDNQTKELKRMVFKPGYSIIGGASKLFKNFIKKHTEYTKYTTFSDCDLGRGMIYDTLGFYLIEESKPNKNYWSDKYSMRIKATSLAMQGADRLMRNIPNYKPVGMGDNLPSNEEIILSYGFLPVYDCGYRKWEYIVK